jgi:hypothetical protein
MINERKLNLLILREILSDYEEYEEYRIFIDENYDISRIKSDYLDLGIEFLNKYAIDKTEKSE